MIHIPKDLKLPIEPTKLTVDVANDEWTPTAVSVEKGDLIIVAANVSPESPVVFRDADDHAPKTPEGIRCVGGQVVKSDNDGALMMKIGTSEYHRVGAVNFRVADTVGEVKFRVRLKKHEGSKGTYRTVLVKFPADALSLGERIGENDKD